METLKIAIVGCGRIGIRHAVHIPHPSGLRQYLMIGAGSVVTKDILKPGIYAGNPSKFMRSIS